MNDNGRKIIEHFKSVDPIMGALAEKHGVPVLKLRRNFFRALVREIIAQQLSSKAARTIDKKFQNLFPRKYPTPALVLETPLEGIRSCGVSYQKASYIKALADAFVKGDIKLKATEKLNDEEIINQLTKIKGIGRWTAEMFLIFSLGRRDVFSFGDNGLISAIKKAYKFKKPVSRAQLEKLTLKWKPYRSAASLILWYSLDIKE